MQRFFQLPNPAGNGYPVIGGNSQAFANADAVYIDTSGFLDVVTTSSKVIGASLHDATMASDNQTVALIKPLYANWLGLVMVYTADQAATQTDLDAYADFGTTTSGAQVLNLAGGATGQMHILGFDPYDEDDDTDVVVEIAEPQQLGFAQT